MKNHLKIVTTNVAGGVGKSTLVKHCLTPLIPNPVRISIEDWNSGDGKSDLDISAKQFYALATQLNTDDEQSFVIDIGTSNSKAMLQHFSDLELTREQIDFWVVPVRAGAKERIDTLKTISKLLEMQIDPKSVIVIAQAVTDVVQFAQDFGPLMEAAKQHGFHFAQQAVLFNEVYDLLKGGEKSVFEIVREKPDFKALRAQHRGDEKKLFQIGHDMLIYSLALTASRNLMAVFQSTPLADAVTDALIESL